jgi:hypothetical protein
VDGSATRKKANDQLANVVRRDKLLVAEGSSRIGCKPCRFDAETHTGMLQGKGWRYPVLIATAATGQSHVSKLFHIFLIIFFVPCFLNCIFFLLSSPFVSLNFQFSIKIYLNFE